MVFRWQCRHCEFTAWAADRAAVVDVAESHLLDHHGSELSDDGFGVRWRCPYCGRERESRSRDEATATFGSHLFEHAESRLTDGAHVADEFGGAGSVLVRAPVRGSAADNVRSHFLAAGDGAVLVTANPAERLGHLRRALGSLPATTSVVTTAAETPSEVDGVDPATDPIDLVPVDDGGLRGVGRAVSTAVADHDAAGERPSVEFDVLPEIVEKFDPQAVFEFLHILVSRLDRADALAHFYVDPRAVDGATLNVLENAFDLTIRARGEAFVAHPG